MAALGSDDIVRATDREDQIRAEEDAWGRIHYRSEWFLRRTLANSVLSSLAAVYIFWHEAPAGPSVQVLALAWVAILTFALTLFDYRTRPASQSALDIARHIPRHLALAGCCLLVGIAVANGIHGISTLLADRPEPTKPVITWREPQPIVSEELPEPVTAVSVSKPVSKPKPTPAPVSKAKSVAVKASVAPPVSRPAVRRHAKKEAPKPMKRAVRKPRTHAASGREKPWGDPVRVPRRTPKHYHLNMSGF